MSYPYREWRVHRGGGLTELWPLHQLWQPQSLHTPLERERGRESSAEVSTAGSDSPSSPLNLSPTRRLFNLALDHLPASFSALRAQQGQLTHWPVPPVSPVPVVDIGCVGTLLHYPARVSLAPLRHSPSVSNVLVLATRCDSAHFTKILSRPVPGTRIGMRKINHERMRTLTLSPLVEIEKMSMTTVQAETSQCLFEFLHMEIVSQLHQEVGPDKKVSHNLTGSRARPHLRERRARCWRGWRRWARGWGRVWWRGPRGTTLASRTSWTPSSSCASSFG